MRDVSGEFASFIRNYAGPSYVGLRDDVLAHRAMASGFEPLETRLDDRDNLPRRELLQVIAPDRGNPASDFHAVSLQPLGE